MFYSKSVFGVNESLAGTLIFVQGGRPPASTYLRYLASLCNAYWKGLDAQPCQ